ncbi:N-6 DNA methylase [Candidatus Saccharibacteria bacterium]|nr:N-6 DNA methylase [Candidatus Saccharibacteria bacterium]
MNHRYSLYKDRNVSDEFIKLKHRGKIYTPDYLVEIILDRAGYTGAGILKKHVMENSCGDGQFVIHIVDRYCKEYLRQSDDKDGLRADLEHYIHAIDIDEDELATCLMRCNIVVAAYGIDGVKWDFVHGNTVEISEFDGKMDYVVGNPPYVRIHNLDEKTFATKEHLFCRTGMTDSYILFYEIGIKMLNRAGTLAYITPSSFYTSLAGSEMRKFLTENNLLVSVCDLKHFQAFKSTTYTTIVCLKKGNNRKSIEYAEFDARTLSPVEISSLNTKDYVVDGKFYFADKDSLASLRAVIECDAKHDFAVKNGYATLADDVFVHDFGFDSKYIIPAVKASCARWTKILYPYNQQGELYSEKELFGDSNVRQYLLSQKERLLRRDGEKGNERWYAFGRSQAIKDTYRDKLAINALIRTVKDVKIVEAGRGTGVYSGLYIVSDTIPMSTFKRILASEDFCKYVALLGKYKSGGYYAYSSKDVAKFINYKLLEKEA